jgi:hypothetical protein
MAVGVFQVMVGGVAFVTVRPVGAVAVADSEMSASPGYVADSV